MIVRGVCIASQFLLLLVLGFGCTSEPHGSARNDTGKTETPPHSPSGPPEPTLAQLRSATYQGLDLGRGPVTLEDGRWEGPPVAPGAASRPAVSLVRDYVLRGDLDGDGQAEAVVLLAASSGGTGELLYLAVVKRAASEIANVATAPLGDRVQLRAGRIESRRIVLDLVQAGAGDPMCCPGDLVTRTWEWSA